MEIIALPIEVDGNDKIDSRYRLVILAAQRARQLMEGGSPVSETRYAKSTTVGLEEVLENKVEFLTGKDARVAQREAKRLREEEIKSRALLEKEEEIASEIKKDLSVYLAERKPAGLNEVSETVESPEAQPEPDEEV
jgi:DNA-directed RNA polymerase subunit omega